MEMTASPIRVSLAILAVVAYCHAFHGVSIHEIEDRLSPEQLRAAVDHKFGEYWSVYLDQCICISNTIVRCVRAAIAALIFTPCEHIAARPADGVAVLS